MDCDVFVLHANSDSREAERVGAGLRGLGLHAVVGPWNPKRKPNCKAAVLIVTGAIVEIEKAVESVLYHEKWIFVLRLASFPAEGKLRLQLNRRPGVRWIEGVARPFEVSLWDLQRALSVHFKLPPLPPPTPETPPPPPAVTPLHEWTAPPRLEDPPLEKKSRVDDGNEVTVRNFLREVKTAKGVLKNVKPLRGFFSYSRNDDLFTGRALSTLREKIAHELHMQLGREVELWQDTREIRGGAKVERRNPKRHRDFEPYFIPVVTPNSVNSENCGFELKAFREQERALNRADLIFPIHYLDVMQLESDEIGTNDEWLELIRDRQLEDYTQLRFVSFEKEEVKRFVGKFCSNINRVLKKQIEASDE